jgi:membrane fusion protein (multidrug efflux system)
MRKYLYSGMLVLLMEIVLDSCQSPVAGAGYSAPPPAILPVFKVSNRPFTTYREYTAALEGSKDIEIRPQVSGYIEKIFIDEGAFVKKDQPLFKINDQPYREALNNASASMVGNAKINIGYSLIKAPVDGYIGRIHIKIGSLAGLSSQDPLTNISEVRDVRAYFSVSETAFLRFKDEYPGKTIEDKIKNLPPVELILSDNNVYPEKGKVEMVSGQFAAGTGAIPFRASFPNPNGILRSGNTGRVRISVQQPDGLVIPQESTFELQDKVFVFVLGDSNKVTGTAIKILGRSGNYYLVENGVKAGDRIVYSGVDKLNDGAKIDPVPMSLDSLLKIRPM